ncbi:histone acetylation protein-domain-containing protein [Biscogniauxia mediterranea]|nr:histone acetylation protein-domain-containing protein [Biscogniauxia mediterranea]
MSTPTRSSPLERDRDRDRDRHRMADKNPLVEEIARALHKDVKVSAYHLSTTPTITDSLCYPPASSPASESKSPADSQVEPTERRPSKPLKTYCERHFLAVSIDTEHDDSGPPKEVLILGLEIYIYTTAFSTIIFVAKADSTGYLHLLNLPKGAPSPIREITAAFMNFLVATRRRPSKQLVVNLFARAQSQYLFPGSVKNKGKHVLDDRGLVKWWCRVLNPLLEEEENISNKARKGWGRIHGYLIIPGLDSYETRAFLPRTSGASKNWTLGHPLEHMSPYSRDPSTFGNDIPPRCLIPTYPDDPKARFVQELEEATSEKAKLLGGWKTPRTLDQFWEMMAFRQECSSGRMTGFVWVVFDPPSHSDQPGSDLTADNPATEEIATATLSANSETSPAQKPKRKRPARKILSGRIVPRKPHIKTHLRAQFPTRIETPHYYWPEAGRGQVVLNENGYKRAVELLTNLEFSTLAQATMSTARWANEVNAGEDWALRIIGERESVPQPVSSSSSGGGVGVVNNLSGMIKRKRPAEEPPKDATSSSGSVNVLSSGLIRKKTKDSPIDETAAAVQDSQEQARADTALRVNVLSTGLVRKKAKESP